jgi:hypothetical protein
MLIVGIALFPIGIVLIIPAIIFLWMLKRGQVQYRLKLLLAPQFNGSRVLYWSVLAEITLVLIVLFAFSNKGAGDFTCTGNVSSGMGYPYMAGHASNITGSNMTLVKKENVDVANLSSPNSTSFDQFNNTDNSGNTSSKFVVKDNITQIKQGTRHGFDESADAVNASECSP